MLLNTRLQHPSPWHKMVSFIKGDKPSMRTKMLQHWSILNGAKGWKIAAQESEYQQHPDIVVWSKSLMVMIITELTVLFELTQTDQRLFGHMSKNKYGVLTENTHNLHCISDVHMYFK